MGEMLTYIFSSLRSSEKRLDVVTRAVNKQRSFNKQLTIFAVMTTANSVSYTHLVAMLADILSPI